MADTLRTEFPADMVHAADSGSMGTWEEIVDEATDWLKRYARENPTSFALWALGIGFVLGWKMKPW